MPLRQHLQEVCRTPVVSSAPALRSVPALRASMSAQLSELFSGKFRLCIQGRKAGKFGSNRPLQEPELGKDRLTGRLDHQARTNRLRFDEPLEKSHLVTLTRKQERSCKPARPTPRYRKAQSPHGSKAQAAVPSISSALLRCEWRRLAVAPCSGRAAFDHTGDYSSGQKGAELPLQVGNHGASHQPAILATRWLVLGLKWLPELDSNQRPLD